jgi:eukaryotic-like serine/threonine-protein kinase
VNPGPELEGKYEILRKIREGGMGAVYEVRHRLLDERRVIKVIHPHLVASPELAERFRREARAASGLRHPNIAHLHDFSVDPDGRAYIIMELIDGLSLDEILRTSGPPPLGLGLEISRQALRAVGFLHRKGFLHRDIAPDNLMLTRDPEGAPLVKLIDLGIAKVLVESDQKLTMAGMFLGKPRYASPEQLAGDSIDGRGDLYSLGIVIYELLTGVCPIQGSNPSTLLASHLFQPPLDFAVSDPAGKLPPDLRAFLLQALAKKPEDRFANAEEMRDRLAAIQERYPSGPENLDAVLVRPMDLDATAVLPRQRPGSTQDRLDRQFLKEEETPGVGVPLPGRTEPIPALRLVPPPPAPPPVAARVPEPAATPVPLVPAIAPARDLPPREPRSRRAGWIAAAAVLALLVLGVLFLGREETVQIQPPASQEVQVAATEPAAAVPAPVPDPVSEKEAEPPPPVPAPVVVQEPEPVPAAPTPTLPRGAGEGAPSLPERTEKGGDKRSSEKPVAPAPPIRKPERSDKPVEVPAVVPPTAPKPKPERPRREAPKENEEEISFIDPPRAVSVPAAPYPEAAVGSGAKGKVVVTFVVNEKGQVSEPKVKSIVIEEGGTAPVGVDVKALFREAALAAARRARFAPATSDGVPVSFSGGELTYDFKESA